MQQSEFPIFTLALHRTFLIAGGGKGPAEYGHKNGVILYGPDLSKLDVYDTRDVVLSVQSNGVAVCAKSDVIHVFRVERSKFLTVGVVKIFSERFWLRDYLLVHSRNEVVGLSPSELTRVIESDSAASPDREIILKRVGSINPGGCGNGLPRGRRLAKFGHAERCASPRVQRNNRITVCGGNLLLLNENFFNERTEMVGDHLVKVEGGDFRFKKYKVVGGEVVSGDRCCAGAGDPSDKVKLFCDGGDGKLVFTAANRDDVHIVGDGVRRVSVPKATCVSACCGRVLVGTGDGSIVVLSCGGTQKRVLRASSLPITNAVLRDGTIYYSDLLGNVGSLREPRTGGMLVLALAAATLAVASVLIFGWRR